MSVDEIKSELDMRGVDYSECVSKQELVKKLIETRVLGKANPDRVFEKFNEVKDLEVNPEVFDSEMLKDSVASDGSLPGGMSPELMKALATDREIVSFLSDPKMQGVMKAVMEGGPSAMKKYMSDPEAVLMLQRLTQAMQRVQTGASPPGGRGPSSSNKQPIERDDDPDVLQ
jgi:hypothetical protein